MRHSYYSLAILATILGFASGSQAQVDEICAEFGAIPSLNSPFAHVPYIYGKVSVKGIAQGAKFPKVNVTLIDRDQIQKRLTVERSGNYCFKPSGGGGTLIVEIDGVEATRRTLASMAAAQQREDFEIFVNQTGTTKPGAIPAKFSHPQNEKTTDLYKKAAEAEGDKDIKSAIRYLKQIVAVDPADFIAWAKLGSLYFEEKSFADAEAAFRKSLELKPEYTPAWNNAGKIRMAQKQYEAAIEVFKHASSIDPSSARTFQLLGEAYLLTKQGSLGVDALNKALEIDPVGMAECHLQLAHLYQLAKANKLATREYKAFLVKVSDHPEKKKFEKFIRENPE